MAVTLLGWSGGKDCAWALHVLRAAGHEVAALVTTIDAKTGRVAMHGVDGALVEAQAASAGVPLWTVPLDWPCSDRDYERAMAAVNRRALAAGIDHAAFGDLHLAEIRAYRERNLRGTGITPLFPLWGEDTRELAYRVCAAGLRARVVCVETARLDAGFLGREYDEAFLRALPPGVDACGENGEFHTFAWDGPMFREPVPVRISDTRNAGGFVYAGLAPAR